MKKCVVTLMIFLMPSVLFADKALYNITKIRNSRHELVKVDGYPGPFENCNITVRGVSGMSLESGIAIYVIGRYGFQAVVDVRAEIIDVTHCVKRSKRVGFYNYVYSLAKDKNDYELEEFIFEAMIRANIFPWDIE